MVFLNVLNSLDFVNILFIYIHFESVYLFFIELF